MLDAVRAYRRRLTERDERGFTLIELMVVVLIIAVLLLIAIPQFLGAQRGAQAKGAQSSLRNAAIAAKSIQQDEGDYTGVGGTKLADREPDLEFGTTANGSVTKANEVSWAVNGDQVTLVVRGANGRCYGMELNGASVGGTAATRYGYTTSGGQATCSTTTGLSWANNQKDGWKS
jgi:type IV pilus assembly protein PilA